MSSVYYYDDERSNFGFELEEKKDCQKKFARGSPQWYVVDLTTTVGVLKEEPKVRRRKHQVGIYQQHGAAENR